MAGDGIGAEVMAATMNVIEWLAASRSVSFDVTEGLVGGASYDAHGVPLTDEALAMQWHRMQCCSVLLVARNMMIWRLI